MSRARAGGIGSGSFSTSSFTAVLRPLMLTSRVSDPIRATGKAIASGFPSRASRSTSGPPGYGRPSNFPTLSNASPAASSRVEPSRTARPRSVT